MILITKSEKETQKFAERFAKKILRLSESRNKKNAIVIGLFGNLGAGKTVFCQGFAIGLRIKKNIHSPTFVIMKKYKIPASEILNLKSKILNLIHIDAYRIQKPKEILDLGWEELVKNPRNIILVEWADKLKKILPKNHIKIKSRLLSEKERKISIDY